MRPRSITPFDSLLPFVTPRVVSSGRNPEGGYWIQFDDDVYLQPLIVPQQSLRLMVIGLWFHLFFNPDGSHSTPPLEVLTTKTLEFHLGYHLTTFGGVLGRSGDRAQMRRVKDELGWGWPMLARFGINESRPLPPGSPRQWAQARFTLRPNRKNGPDGYNWEALGSQILSSLETILQLLEIARPDQGSQRLEPR